MVLLVVKDVVIRGNRLLLWSNLQLMSQHIRFAHVDAFYFSLTSTIYILLSRCAVTHYVTYE